MPKNNPGPPIDPPAERVDTLSARLMLKAIVDSTSDMIWSVDSHGFGLLTFNRALADYFLQQRNIVIKVGDHPKDLFPANEFMESWQAFYQRALNEGPYQVDYQVFAGSLALELHFNLLKQNEKTFGISVFGRDVTAQKQAQKQLARSTESYRQLFESSGTGVIIIDESGKYLLANKIAAANLGASPEEVVGRSLFDYLSPAQATQYLEQNRQLIESGGRREYEDTFQLATGEHTYLIVDQCLQDESGRNFAVQSSSIDISARKQTEAVMRADEQKLRTLFDTMSEGITLNEMIYNEQGEMVDYRILEVNEAFYRIADAKPGQVIGSLATQLYGMSSDFIRSFWESHKADKETIHSEMLSPVNDRIFYISTSPFQNDRFVTSFFDITDRKRAEQALRESEEKFRHMFEYSVAPKSITQLNGEMNVNQAFCDMLGYTREELDHRTWQELTHPEDVALNQQSVEPLFSGEQQSVRFTKRYIHKNGSIVWADIGTAIRRGADGEPLYQITTINDITARRQAEQKLKESEERLTSIFDSSLDAITVVDLQGTISMCNQAAAEIHGFTASDQMVGRPFLDLVAEEDHQAALEGMHKITTQGAMKEMPFTGLKANGDRFAGELSVSLIRDGSGQPSGFVGITKDISQRKSDQIAQQESEKRYRGLFEESPMCIWEEDFSQVKRRLEELKVSGVSNFRTYFDEHPQEILNLVRSIKVMDVNQAAITLMEAADKDQLIGNLNEVISIEEDMDFRDEFVSIAAGNSEFEWDGVLHTLSGRKLTVSVRWVAVSGYSDSLEKVLVSMLNITERRQAQLLQQAVYEVAVAAETTTALDQLYPQIHEIIARVMPAENFFIALYDEKENLLRFPYFKNVEDAPYINGVHPGRGATAYVLRTSRSLLATQKVHEELERKGELILLGVPSAIWLGVPLIVDGKTIGAMVVQHYSDPQAYGEREQHMLEFVSTQVAIAISRLQAEEQLRLSEEKFRTIMEQITDLVYQTDREGAIAYVSPACKAIFGYTPAEMVGRPFKDFLDGKDVDRAMAAFERAFTSGKPSQNLELNMRRKGGSLFLGELNGALSHRKDFLGNIGLIRDITKRKKTEDEIRRLNTSLEKRVQERTQALEQAQVQLVRQEKLATLGQLAAGVGHELRNPLGAIQASAYYLKLVLPEATAKVKQHLEMIEQDVFTASRIIGDLLDFGRVVTPEQQFIAVSELIEQALQRFPPGDSVRVRRRIAQALPPVYVDPLHAEQILGNLITNACQSMPAARPGQPSQAQETGQLTISAAVKDGMLAIAVKDSGSGISVENMNKLFEPLFTTKTRGIGLGLAVSKKLAEANHGWIGKKQTWPG